MEKKQSSDIFFLFLQSIFPISFMRRHLLYIIIILLSLLFTNCGNRSETSQNPRTKKVITKKGNRVTNKDNFSFGIIDTSVFYIGHVEDKDVAIQIDKSEEQLIEGKFFVLSNTIAQPHPFAISRKNRKCFFETDGHALQFDFEAVHDTISMEALVQFASLPEDSIIKMEFSKMETPQFQICESNRYLEEGYEIEKIPDVPYGEARGYWCSLELDDDKYLRTITRTIAKTVHKKDVELSMDIYRPIEDSVTKRPLIVLLHGGAFYIGDKGDFAISDWCEHFAKAGYVAASINYRMGFKISKKSIQECGFMAIQDAHAAMRYLVHNADQYGIDPNYLFIGGASAGAITALNMVYMSENSRPPSTRDLGEKWSSGNNLAEAFRIKAIVNLWGAIYDLNDLNLTPTPIISFHGTDDPIVPIDHGHPFADISKRVGERLFDEMYGSQSIHQRLDSLRIRNEFYPLKGAKHGPHKTAQNKPTQYFYMIQEKTTDFLYYDISHTPEITQLPEDPRIYSIASNEIQELYWQVEGGFILGTEGNNIKVVWNSEEAKHTLTASGFKKNGASFRKTKDFGNHLDLATN